MNHSMKHLMFGMAVIVALVLVGCGDDGNEETGPHFVESVAVPGLSGPGNTASFDLGTVATGRHYFTDRNNASVDVINTATNTLVAQITGSGANAFSGCRSATGAPVDCAVTVSRRSGPNGIDAVSATRIYAPDVDSVKVIDTTSNTVIKSIKVGPLTGAGFTDTASARADEG